MSDDKHQRIVVPIASVDGSEASTDGTQIMVGFTIENGEQANAIMSAKEGTALLGYVSLAIGQALRQQENPNQRWAFLAEQYSIAPPQSDQLLTFSFRIPGGGELSFQLDLSGARGFLEALSVVLGAAEIPSVPKNQTH